MLSLQDHYRLSCTSKRTGKSLIVTVHVNDVRTGEVQIQILEFALGNISRLSKAEKAKLVGEKSDEKEEIVTENSDEGGAE